MKEKRELRYIFHLFRKEGVSLILHPFATPEKLVQCLENDEIKGRYGAEPRAEALTMLKNDFYRTVEVAVRHWLSDVRFIPKFLLSAVLFLVTYFFLALVIRDPVPLIDEIAISLGVSVLAYFLLGRRDMKSEMAAKKRIALRTAVDRITFEESDFVRYLETSLHENESLTLHEVVQRIVEPGSGKETEMGSSEKEEAKHFVRACEMMFKLQNLKKEEKALKRYLEKSEKKGSLRDIKKWAESKKIDFPLYAVYKGCKQRVAGSK